MRDKQNRREEKWMKPVCGGAGGGTKYRINVMGVVI